MGKVTLKDLRKQHGKLTQAGLADLINAAPGFDVSRQAVGHWERGERQPNRRLVKRLAEIFGRPYTDIDNIFDRGNTWDQHY